MTVGGNKQARREGKTLTRANVSVFVLDQLYSIRSKTKTWLKFDPIDQFSSNFTKLNYLLIK